MNNFPIDEVFLIQQYGDFDVPVTIGVATDTEHAVKMIKNSYPKGTPIIDLGDGKFKAKGASDIQYFYEKVRVNKLV